MADPKEAVQQTGQDLRTQTRRAAVWELQMANFHLSMVMARSSPKERIAYSEEMRRNTERMLEIAELGSG